MQLVQVRVLLRLQVAQLGPQGLQADVEESNTNLVAQPVQPSSDEHALQPTPQSLIFPLLSNTPVTPWVLSLLRLACWPETCLTVTTA